MSRSKRTNRGDIGDSPGSKRVAVMLDLNWPYRRHTGVFVGTQRYAREQGWNCVVDEFVHATLADNPKLAAYDGIIARVTAPLARMAEKAKVPLVNVWFNSPATTQFHGVFADFKSVGRMAAEHLMQRGFQRFACLSGAGDTAQVRTSEGFHEVIRARGCACDCLVVERQYFDEVTSWRRFRKDVRKWIERWKYPIGVCVTFPDVTARHVASAVLDAGLSIPEQVAIIQSDNDPVLNTDPAPGLTGVDIAYEAIGYKAAEVLDELMNARPAAELHQIVGPTSVVARKSTDFLAVDDELVAKALRCISETAHENIDVDDVCKQACSGRRTLERRFQSVLGRTIGDEILRQRIERAKRELAYTSTPIKQVARLSGFRDAKRLHEAFVREIKQSPSAYREGLHLRSN